MFHERDQKLLLEIRIHLKLCKLVLREYWRVSLNESSYWFHAMPFKVWGVTATDHVRCMLSALFSMTARQLMNESNTHEYISQNV